MMKKFYFLISMISLMAMSAFSQTNKEEIEFYQSIFGMEKKAVVAEFITLKGEAATTFWDLYDKYETERKLHGQKRIALLNRYAMQYESLDDEKTEVLMKDMISIGNEYNKLISKYYKSIKKASGIKTAAQFYQLEAYFQSVIRLEILEQIPFIGEFDE
ncbi:MAG: hypothetical protein KAV87_67805 [Desulfobacteraceae bacterium]|nr:hypothetical protein [Desulfobacteraceae bacterium]